MDTFKEIWGLRNLGLCLLKGMLAIIIVVSLTCSASAESCVAPLRPFVPSEPQSVRDYADIIRSDFELYIRDIQSYFRCLEEERARAFVEAREVSREYGEFLQTLER